MIVTAPVRAPVWVGVKVTRILQAFPAARVLPHGFNPETRAKSPLIPMLLMFSVADPEFVRVTTFGPFVVPTSTFPHASDVGVKVTAGPRAAVTVSWTVVVCVREPDVPVMVTVEVPVAALALAVRVSVLTPVVGLGLKPAVTPFGKPEALSVTLPLKPF